MRSASPTLATKPRSRASIVNHEAEFSAPTGASPRCSRHPGGVVDPAMSDANAPPSPVTFSDTSIGCLRLLVPHVDDRLLQAGHWALRTTGWSRPSRSARLCVRLSLSGREGRGERGCLCGEEAHSEALSDVDDVGEKGCGARRVTWMVALEEESRVPVSGAGRERGEPCAVLECGGGGVGGVGAVEVAQRREEVGDAAIGGALDGGSDRDDEDLFSPVANNGEQLRSGGRVAELSACLGEVSHDERAGFVAENPTGSR